MSYLEEPLDESVLEDVYSWIDQIPLSKPKKNFARDFADAGMVAEVISHYFPRLVEIHNYPSTTVTKTKIENWIVLNRKVLRRLDFQLADDVIQDIIHCKPYVIERVLVELRQRIDHVLWEQQKKNTQSDAAESDQYRPSPKQIVKIRKFPPQPKSKVDKSADDIDKQTKTSKKITKTVSTEASSVVPRWKYDSKEQECQDKDETMFFLQTKISKLDQLLQLKDLRIEELMQENLQLKKANKTKKPVRRF